jgi:hypothetical protein
MLTANQIPRLGQRNKMLDVVGKKSHLFLCCVDQLSFIGNLSIASFDCALCCITSLA